MKSNYFFLAFLMLFILIITIVMIVPTWQQNMELKKKTELLQKEVNILIQKKNFYINHLKILDQDSFYAEFLLRENFHFARKNEIILKEETHARSN